MDIDRSWDEDYQLVFMVQVIALIQQGNTQEVISILDEHHLHREVDTTTTAFLHYAVHYGNLQLVEYLVNLGYDVNVRDLIGTSALMIAMSKNNQAVIRTLINAGAELAMVNHWNDSALRAVFLKYDELSIDTKRVIFQELPKQCCSTEDMAKKLINAGCKLYQAAQWRYAQVLEYMVQHDFPVDYIHPRIKKTALNIAISLDDVDSVKILLLYGADANALDKQGLSYLYRLYSIRSKHTREKVEILKMLLDAGASPTSCTPRGAFQSDPILQYGDREAIRVLLEANINCKAKNEIYGKTVLHGLAYNEMPGVVDELKCHIDKFDINAIDKHSCTALHDAVYVANVEMVKFLLSQGSLTNCMSRYMGYTPLYYVFLKVKAGFEEQADQCLEILLQHDADAQFVATNMRDGTITIFDIATRKNRIDSLKIVVAQLAILEAMGKPISPIILSKINLHASIKEYYSRCQKLLTRKIYGSVTLFQLLTVDQMKMARYAVNGELVLKLIHLSYKQTFKSSYSYYRDVVKKQLIKGIQCVGIVSEAAKVICHIFKGSIDRNCLVVDKILNYLDDTSRQQLYQLSKEM